MSGHRDVVELMMERGANDYNRAMASAAVNGYRDIVDMLMEKQRQ
jgi:ankyrin repeat protein